MLICPTSIHAYKLENKSKNNMKTLPPHSRSWARVPLLKLCWKGVLVPLSCCNKNTMDSGGSYTTETYFSQFWRLQVQDQGLPDSVLLSGEDPHLLFMDTCLLAGPHTEEGARRLSGVSAVKVRILREGSILVT